MCGTLFAFSVLMDTENLDHLPCLARKAINWMIEESDAESIFETALREQDHWKDLPEQQRFEVILQLLQ